MKTRSQTRYEKSALYDFDFDFDDASIAWKSNKKSLGLGMYKYICPVKSKNGKNCNFKCLAGEIYCKNHLP
jgi:hypothetical protein